jgi:hypothetical protein
MGTSSSNTGSSGSNPLIPTWLADPIQGGQEVAGENSEAVENPKPDNGTQPLVVSTVDPQRYTAARSNFTRFVKSGGSDTGSLRRATSSYVRRSSGGAKNATTKMGSSRKAASKLLGFLQETSSKGIESVLKSLNLQNLAGRPINEIFIELSDFLCPEGGSVDDGIAREAFIKTIADISEEETLNDDGNLSSGQVQAIFELYMTHTIEDKLLNEIGTNTFFQTQTLEDAELVQDQLHDFIKNNVSDALANTDKKIEGLSQDEIGGFVDSIYESTFTLLASLYQESESQ